MFAVYTVFIVTARTRFVVRRNVSLLTKMFSTHSFSSPGDVMDALPSAASRLPSGQFCPFTASQHCGLWLSPCSLR